LSVPNRLGQSLPEQWMTEENQNEQGADENSQVTEDSPKSYVADLNGESKGFAFGDDALTKYPTYVRAALDYAAENKYAYGPRFRNSEIKWNVISVEPMSNNIARVRVEFVPASGFRGDPGVEYMDVDAGGAVLARRQISIPKESSPVMLAGITAFSVVLAVVLISLMTVFKPESGDPLYVAGRTLWIRAEEPRGQDFIVYNGADAEGAVRTWAMKPVDEANNELVYVKITLINQTSGTVNLVIDEKAVTLLDGNRKTFTPVNTINTAYAAESTKEYNVPGFVPMWGSLTLNESEQVAGMMVFEMPRNSSFTEIRWTATDSATIKYQ
jgi:hypothetical protein